MDLLNSAFSANYIYKIKHPKANYHTKAKRPGYIDTFYAPAYSLSSRSCSVKKTRNPK